MNKCGFYKALQRGNGARSPGAPSDRRTGDWHYGQGRRGSQPWTAPKGGFLPWGFPRDEKGEGAQPGNSSARSPVAALSVGRGGSRAGAGRNRGGAGAGLRPRLPLT